MRLLFIRIDTDTNSGEGNLMVIVQNECIHESLAPAVLCVGAGPPEIHVRLCKDTCAGISTAN